MTDKGYSDREVAARSGGRVSHETVRRIRIGTHSGNLEEDTVTGLVVALDLRRSDILTSIGQTIVAELGPWQPPAVADRMSRKQRRAVEQLISAMVEPDHRGTVKPLTQLAPRSKAKDADASEPDRLRAVARKRSPHARPLNQDEDFS